MRIYLRGEGAKSSNCSDADSIWAVADTIKAMYAAKRDFDSTRFATGNVDELSVILQTTRSWKAQKACDQHVTEHRSDFLRRPVDPMRLFGRRYLANDKIRVRP
ncbi:MAG TPA: hypothetical protein VKB88_03895 [Bryobacteraceae bacterium]|nr:hypothetical protein [Bryobacteraceae bacterium]